MCCVYSTSGGVLRLCNVCYAVVLSSAPRVGITVDGSTLPARAVVIAMGPWSGDAAAWFPGLPRIGGQKAHSILVCPAQPIGPDCLFAQFVTSSGGSSQSITPSSSCIMCLIKCLIMIVRVSAQHFFKASTGTHVFFILLLFLVWHALQLTGVRVSMLLKSRSYCWSRRILAICCLFRTLWKSWQD